MIRTALSRCACRCPWGLLGMLALVAIVEAAIDARSLAIFDMEDVAFRFTAHAAASRARKAQVLCFGDSLVKLSVIPSVVAERAGKRVYNLALSGSQAPTSYFLLKRALDSGARPEAVVVDFNPPLLRVGPRHIATRWAALLGPVDGFRLARWAGDKELFGEIALGHLVPSFRGRITLRLTLMEALAGRSTITLPWNELAVRNWRSNSGAQLMTGSAAAQNLPPAEIRRLREGYYPEWSCHPANLAGVDRFLGLAASKNIRVFWVVPALVPALQDAITASGIDAQHDAFLRRWQEKYPNLVILDARRKVTEIDAFWDPQHLSVVGASAFSKALGDVLRRSLGGKLDGRWLAMPDVKVGPRPDGIEDLDQSRLAVEKARLRR